MIIISSGIIIIIIISSSSSSRCSSSSSSGPHEVAATEDRLTRLFESERRERRAAFDAARAELRATEVRAYGRQGDRLFCKEFLGFNTMPCRLCPVVLCPYLCTSEELAAQQSALVETFERADRGDQDTASRSDAAVFALEIPESRFRREKSRNRT